MLLDNKKIFIIDGPSGCGKTTIAKELEKLNQSIKYIASSTTREKRLEEIDGIEHFFITEEKFSNKVFLGLYYVYFNKYGIDTSNILSSNAENIILTYHVYESKIYEDLISANVKYITFLILPDNKSVLKQRIIKRDPSLSLDRINARLDGYEKLLTYKDKYDYVLTNEEGCLNNVVAKIYNIIINS